MTTIDKIRAEIRRLYAEDSDRHIVRTSLEALSNLMDFLDTLEAETSYDTQKYTPSPSVDIGDVARVQFASHAKVFDKKRKAVFDWEQFKEVAGIFYGFGQRNSILEEPVSEDLEEEIREYMSNEDNNPYDWDWRDKRDCARHFAEWGAEHLRDTTEKISEDLESEIEKAGKDVLRQAHKHNKIFYIPQTHFEDVQLMDIFKSGVYKGYELGREAGAEWQKAKIMEGAVETYYGYVNNTTRVFLPEKTLKGVKEGYNRIIILKDYGETK